MVNQVEMEGLREGRRLRTMGGGVGGLEFGQSGRGRK
jgi:hypothetical protein